MGEGVGGIKTYAIVVVKSVEYPRYWRNNITWKLTIRTGDRRYTSTRS
jgi:hypothetical protein